MKVKPRHSVKPNREVYHDESSCTERNNIEKENVRPGKGGKRKCSKCKKISG